MVTVDGLKRQNSILDTMNLSISREYKIARYPISEDFFLKMAYRYKNKDGGYEEYGVCCDN